MYLTEERLKNFISFLFSDTKILFNKNFYNYKPDIFIPDINLIIEFDGYFHFSSSKNILRDIELNKLCKNNNITIIHIPYFIQLDKQIYDLIFKKYVQLNQKILDTLKEYSYPHGFIDNKALLPSNYCSLGIKQFEYFLNYFNIIQLEIIKSLNQKIVSGKNIYEVFPINYYIKWNTLYNKL